MPDRKPEFNPEIFRTHFPHLETGSIYLNHAALSPLPRPSLSAATAILKNRQTAGVDVFRDELPVIEQARRRAAELIGVSGPESIAFVQNTSTGLSMISKGLPLEKGDEILIYEKEFPSNVYPWKLREKDGVRIRFVQDKGGYPDFEEIIGGLTPKTKVLAISGVQFLSGYRINLEKLGRACRENGTLLVVDAIQMAGPCEIKAEEWGIDALCCGGHKWLMAPRGIGLMYISEKLLSRIEPVLAGWLSVGRIWDFFDTGQPYHPDMKRFEPGTFNISGIAALGESIGLLLEAGQPAISTHLNSLINRLDSNLSGARLQRYGNQHPAHASGIAAYRLPTDVDAENLAERLAAKNIFISARAGLIRISPYFYNKPEEIDITADMIIREVETSA